MHMNTKKKIVSAVAMVALLGIPLLAVAGPIEEIQSLTQRIDQLEKEYYNITSDVGNITLNNKDRKDSIIKEIQSLTRRIAELKQSFYDSDNGNISTYSQQQDRYYLRLGDILNNGSIGNIHHIGNLYGGHHGGFN